MCDGGMPMTSGAHRKSTRQVLGQATSPLFAQEQATT